MDTNAEYRGSLHFVCLQAVGPHALRLDVVQWPSGRVLMQQPVDEQGTNQLASFVDDDGTLRVLLAVPNRQNGTSMYGLDASGNSVRETHTVNTQYVSTMRVWRMQLNDQWQLAIANQPALYAQQHQRQQVAGGPSSVYVQPQPLSSSHKPIISVHSWRSTYFDADQLIELPHDGYINKLEPMHINGQEFLVVAMEPSHFGHSPESSLVNSSLSTLRNRGKRGDAQTLIYRLDYGDAEQMQWTLFDTIHTRLALDARAFSMTYANSPHVEYFVAILGQMSEQHRLQQQVTNNNNDTAPFGLLIFKYLGDKFALRRFYAAPYATKLDAIAYGTGDADVAIALLSQITGQVEVLQFNGHELRPVSAMPHQQQQQRALNQPAANVMYARNRRTMDMADVHLFLGPPESQQNIETQTDTGSDGQESVAKRTLTADTMIVPTLAVSKVSNDEFDEQIDSVAPTTEASQTSQDQTGSLLTLPLQTILDDDDDGAKPSVDKRSGSGEDLFGWCRARLEHLLNDDFALLAQQIQSLPRVNQPRPIEIFGDLIIDDDLRVTNLLFANRVEAASNLSAPMGVPAEGALQLSGLTLDAIVRTHADIDALKRRIDNILVDDGTPQDVFAPLAFDSLLLDCMEQPMYGLPQSIARGCPFVNELRTRLLNGRNIENLTAQASRAGRSHVVARDVRFEHLVLRGNAFMGQLNGIRVDDIVFKRSGLNAPRALITGVKRVPHVRSNVPLRVGLWNGANVKRDTYLTSSGAQRVTGHLQLGNVILNTTQQRVSHRIGTINNVDMRTHLAEIAVSARGLPQSIDAPGVEFDELVLAGPVRIAQPAARVSGLDLDAVWRNTMFKHTNQNVSAPIEFAGDVHATHGSDIGVAGPLNGARFELGNVLMRDSDALLPSPVHFVDSVRARDVRLELALNGIQVLPHHRTHQPELAILYNQGEQLVSGDKIFGDVRLGGSTLIKQPINGYLNLSHLDAITRFQSGPNPLQFRQVTLTGRDIRVPYGYMQVAQSVNALSARHLCEGARSVALAQRAQYKRLRLEQHARFKRIRCARINGMDGDLARTFLTRFTDQHVRGALRLHGGAVFNTSTQINRALNGLEVASLGHSIKESIRDAAMKFKEVRGNLYVDELIIDNKLNELRAADVFSTRSDVPQFVRAPWTFEQLDIENKFVMRNRMHANTFNSLNITNILTQTLQYDTPQVIYDHVHLGALEVPRSGHLRTGALNGHQMGRVYADAVLVDVPQQILAPKTWHAPVELNDRCYVRHGIDALASDELRAHALLHSNITELIDDDLVFDNDVVVKGELTIQSGMINDIDLNSFVETMLSEQAARSDALRVVGNGSVRFKDVQLDNLVVAGTIQGVDLSQQALTRAQFANSSHKLAPLALGRTMGARQQQPMRLPSGVFHVASKYQNVDHTGTCFVHSCAHPGIQVNAHAPVWRPNLQQGFSPPPPPQPLPTPAPVFIPALVPPTSVPQAPIVYVPQQPSPPPPLPPTLVHTNIVWPQPIPYAPLGLNRTIIVPFAPTQTVILTPKQTLPPPAPLQQPLPQPQALMLHAAAPAEYQTMLRTRAIDGLVGRVNKLLAVSLYYDIAHQHPLIGPILHAAPSPNIIDKPGSSVLIVKAMDKDGEPCLSRAQSLALMTQTQSGPPNAPFELASRIQETDKPLAAESINTGDAHYLFVIDVGLSLREGSDDFAPDNDERARQAKLVGPKYRLMIFVWNQETSMYDLSERIMLPGQPTAMRPFLLPILVDQRTRQQINGVRACVALAMPRANMQQGLMQQLVGGPMIWCQQAPRSFFNLQSHPPMSVRIANVFDLDVGDVLVTSDNDYQVVIGTLSHHAEQHIGDLDVIVYDMSSRSHAAVEKRRLKQPTKLHFVRSHSSVSPKTGVISLLRRRQQQQDARGGGGGGGSVAWQLVVSESISATDSVLAETRIFDVHFGNIPNYISLVETQTIKDNQVIDIQSVGLDAHRSLLFLRSANSVAIYAPTSVPNDSYCGPQYELVQRLSTRNANRFAVFNSALVKDTFRYNNTANTAPRLGHFLVLSRDDCEQQQHSTVILKAKFG